MRLVTALGVAATAVAGVLFYHRATTTRAGDGVRRLAVDSLGSPAGPGSSVPNLAVGSDGRVYMSWLEPADSGHALRFAILDGTRWSAARTIRAGRDFFVNWADFPSLEVGDDGRLAAHWLQRTGRGSYAYGVRISQSADSGRTWSVPVTPHRDGSDTEHGFVAMWWDKGDLGAAWLDGRQYRKEQHNAANEMMLLATSVSDSGALGTETRLDDRTCDCCQTAVALTADGPIVAYRDRSPDEIRDIYVTRRIGGRWLPGALVHADNWKIAACPVNGPSVAAAGKRVALAWFTAASDSPRVLLAFSDDAGGSFGAPSRIDGGQPAGRVDVALLGDGGALVTWIERTGGDMAAVRARYVSRDGRPGAPHTVASSSSARASGFPRMVLAGSDAVFAWTVPGAPSTIRVGRVATAELR